jgi:putative intracellular protease/amidase
LAQTETTGGNESRSSCPVFDVASGKRAVTLRFRHHAGPSDGHVGPDESIALASVKNQGEDRGMKLLRGVRIGLIPSWIAFMSMHTAWALGASALPWPMTVVDAAQGPSRAMDQLPAFSNRLSRSRPLVVIVGENNYTELTDFVVPFSILSASRAADVVTVGTQAGPLRMFPASVWIQPDYTIADFDARFPKGADYVVVPAVHRYADATLLGWIRSQSQKGGVVIGVCDGVLSVAASGLLKDKQATGHWYSFADLRQQYPQTKWQRHLRYIADGNVITTTGVTATIPMSLALVEAIAGRPRALQLAQELGGIGYQWSAEHPSERFALTWQHKFTIAKNAMAIWRHESLGIEIKPGIDELALALTADVHSTTYRSTTYLVSEQERPIRTLRGLSILPTRQTKDAGDLRWLKIPTDVPPLLMLDRSLASIKDDYGLPTALWVATQMEYPGFH